MKIAVFHGVSSKQFMSDIVNVLSLNHEVVVSDSVDAQQIYSLLQWADVAWIEWASHHAIIISQLPKICPLVVRVHSAEIFLPMSHEIKWTSIDHIIFVSPLIQNLFNELMPIEASQVPQSIIYNAVALNKFSLKKSFAKTHKIACVQLYLDGTKNPIFAVQCFYELLRENSALTLHFTGTRQYSVEGVRLYIALRNSISELGLQDKVFFEENIDPDKMSEWLEDKDYLLSTSIFESFGMSIAEAMSKGIMPLIYGFQDAAKYFPKQCIFSHIAQCVERFKNPVDPMTLRQHITDNYALNKQAAKLQICLEESVRNCAKAKAPENFVQQYWETRYSSGGNSGSGSYGRLAHFKAKTINDFVVKNAINSVLELGCGDGHQLSLAHYPQYYGFDISASTIAHCKQLFNNDASKQFFVYDSQKYLEESASVRGSVELALSLDVIFHLVEDQVFDDYMNHLFSSSSKYVIIYSSNVTKPYAGGHERYRKFTKWITANKPEWVSLAFLKNPFPFDPNHPTQTSNSDFYFFAKQGA